MIAMFAMAALAVDFSMLLGRRAEAQRAADAAALAGASAYKDFAVPTDARDLARARAIEYAAANHMGGDFIDVDSSGGGGTTVDGSDWTVQTREAFIEITPGNQRVRVVIRREGMGTWFARIIGRAVVGVAADAVAEVVDAGSSSPCVMPFAIPDIWHDVNQDANGNHIQDGAEQWTFTPGTDVYERYNPKSPTSTQNGYGSAWRDNQPVGVFNDYGRQIILKPQGPGDALGPSNFNLWSFTEDSSAGRGGEGGIFDRVLNCDPRSIEFGNPDLYQVAPGNSVSLKAPIQQLLDRDPGAYWDGTGVAGSSYEGDWRSSPRIFKVALYEPYQTATLGDRQPIIFNNIAMFFLEGFVKGKGPESQNNIAGRFLYYADGGPGPTEGPLVKYLKLVQ